jgi:hypothetical protein
MTESFTAYGHVDSEGRIRIYHLDVLQHALEERFSAKSIMITYAERTYQFSDGLRNYYFGPMLTEMQRAFYDAGWDISKKEIDTWLRSQFLYFETYDPETDTWIRENHTLKKKKDSEITPRMFRHYIDNCIRFAAEYLSWPIAYPNEELNDNEK